MNRPELDTQRAFDASRTIIDERHPDVDCAEILVTLEHTIATVLIVLMHNPEKAAKMLNEGLLQGVEERLAMFAAGAQES